MTAVQMFSMNSASDDKETLGLSSETCYGGTLYHFYALCGK
jgi:hypothetical protein